MNPEPRQISRAIAMAGVALWFAALAPGAALGTTKGSCTLTKTKYLMPTTGASTTSTSFVNVPTSKVTFTQSKAGCVIVHFAAYAAAGASNNLTVETLLDDTTLGGHGEMFFASDNGTGDARQTVFVFPDVSAGAHFIQMKYRTTNGSIAVQLNDRTIIVQYQ